MGEILVSVMMTVYNDVSILPMSIESVRKQTYDNWELLILDNSDINSDAWKILLNYEKIDKRISIYKITDLEKNWNGVDNVGWAKGSSLLLKRVKGKYTFLLAADDLLDENAFERIRIESESHDPDIIWVGQANVNYKNKKFSVLSANIPQYAVFDGQNKVMEIDYVLRNVYYNSMFHFSKVSFLRKYHIDFFDPYYLDCASMTAVLCLAKKMVVLDDITYYLTLNTSQTEGKVIWNFYKMFALQWKLIKRAYIENQCSDQQIFSFAARRILNNFISNFNMLLQGAQCRDEYMNRINIDDIDRINQAAEAIKDINIRELYEVAGEIEMLRNIENVLKTSIGEEK